MIKSGWYQDEKGWYFHDAKWPHTDKPAIGRPYSVVQPPPPKAKRPQRRSKRCGALLKDGQRCAGPYLCEEHG